MRFTELAKASEGFSGADVELACEKAKLSVIRSIINEASEETPVTKQDLLDAIPAVNDNKNAVNIIIVE
jgi:SpoVK/Ycf46/Vps4 family AAA+-type ATPase